MSGEDLFTREELEGIVSRVASLQSHRKDPLRLLEASLLQLSDAAMGLLNLDRMNGGNMLVGNTAVKRVLADVTIRDATTGMTYNIQQEYASAFPHEALKVAWEEGRFSCDCYRSTLIHDQVDKNMPYLDCGKRLVLVKLETRDIQ